jgi:hypothetical protein
MGKDEKALAEMEEGQKQGQNFGANRARAALRKAPAAAAPMAPPGRGFNGGGGGGSFGLAAGDRDADGSYKRMEDMSKSVASIASASKVGELFQYTVGNVSLPRQRSAMIPIVTDDVELEKLSIYNPAVLPRNPLNGARLKNTTGKHLLQGPITVIDGSSYAGDARIDNVPPGQERLISYGVDLQVLVDGTKTQDTDAIQTGKIVKGVLWLTHKLVHTHNYTAENKGDGDKTLIMEHAFRSGWKLIEPEKPLEKTDTLYRFKESLPKGKSAGLKVVEELINSQQIALLNFDLGSLEFYSKSGSIPKDVKDVLTKAIGLRNEMTETQRQLDERRRQINEITTEQTRIRENIKTVDRNSDYAGRLLKKLNDQETAIEKLQAEATDLQKTLDNQRKNFENYLQNTTVDDK